MLWCPLTNWPWPTDSTRRCIQTESTLCGIDGKWWLFDNRANWQTQTCRMIHKLEVLGDLWQTWGFGRSVQLGAEVLRCPGTNLWLGWMPWTNSLFCPTLTPYSCLSIQLFGCPHMLLMPGGCSGPSPGPDLPMPLDEVQISSETRSMTKSWPT